MNTFVLISGWIFWILIAAVVLMILITSLFDRWEAYKEKQNASIQIDATRKMGTSIFSSAHWLHGDDYEDIPPYVLMKTLGENINI